MPTTTKLADFMGRALVNPSPGVSQATDYAGRDIGAGDTDYNGVALTDLPRHPAADWVIATAYDVGDRVALSGGAVLECTVAGTSDAVTEPVPPAVGATVVDATVTWRRIA